MKSRHSHHQIHIFVVKLIFYYLCLIHSLAEPPPAGWWSIWKGPRAKCNMVAVHLAWSIYIVVYYGMLLNIRAFSRDHLEINTAIAGWYFI